ncbi:ABC-type multidrug transport system ATPase subunit [Pedobacter sp. UYP30]|uniref:ABC transporter ATP-binding protein n=1 Tax=Pedobacter sp. UYP30 TaxID=1756400 RepID=UPI003395757B
MKITLTNIGRRFNRDWIFRHIEYEFTSGNSYAILGANGSGKSTLISVLNGSLTPSEGQITYSDKQSTIDVSDVYKEISLAAPYLELVETFTLKELINFHFKFKEFSSGMNASKLIRLLGLESSAHKEIRYFSSGMKQRTKLALAFCAATSILFLDEPTSNLDAQGLAWYNELTENFSKDKIIIVGSNQEHEYNFCSKKIQVSDYKLFEN